MCNLETKKKKEVQSKSKNMSAIETSLELSTPSI